MDNKTVKTPKYWQKERFQPMIEVETAYGHKVKIPKRFSDGWLNLSQVKEWKEKRGLDVLGGLEIHKETNEIYYDLERVFYEIYEEDD